MSSPDGEVVIIMNLITTILNSAHEGCPPDGEVVIIRFLISTILNSVLEVK